MRKAYTDVYKVIEQEKAVFKIVTKTKNEGFFIEKWIVHHLNILKDTRLIVFDNMSDDEYVHSIYKKYRDNIILVKFDMYMDCIHMANTFMQLYKSLSISSKFFTIIDSDEFLYFYDGGKIVKNGSIIQFLEDSTDCNFFAPCWLENIADNEKLFAFSPHNLSLFHSGKPIINTNVVQMFELALNKYENPILHHTQELPILTYGKAPTRFLLLHFKNLNKYQRIKSNMQKLVSFKLLKNDKDFSSLLKLSTIDLNTITMNNYIRNYLIETLKLIESILHTNDQHTNFANKETVEICYDGTLKFIPESYKQDFINLMNSDYFNLINFDKNKIDINQFTTIKSCRHICITETETNKARRENPEG
jgi:hypothetical protein